MRHLDGVLQGVCVTSQWVQLAAACHVIVMPPSITEPHTHLQFMELDSELSGAFAKSLIKTPFVLGNNI